VFGDLGTGGGRASRLIKPRCTATQATPRQSSKSTSQNQRQVEIFWRGDPSRILPDLSVPLRCRTGADGGIRYGCGEDGVIRDVQPELIPEWVL